MRGLSCAQDTQEDSLLDFTTLAIVLFISNLLQITALIVQMKLATRYSGTGWWTLGIGFIALGFLAMFLRALPGLTAIGVFANNLFFVGGHILFYTGVMRFFELRERSRVLIVFLAAYVVVDFFFVFIYDHIIWRGSILYLTIAGLSFLTAWSLWKYRPSSLAASSNFLAVAFILHGLVFVIGFALVLLAPPAANSPTARNPAQVLGILDGLIATTLWTFGFVLMVTQRLNVAERQTRKEFELIFYASPDAVILSRMEDGYLVEVNDGFATLSGFSREEALGNYSMEGLHFWKSQADRQRMLDELSLNGTCKDLEFEFRRKDGSGLTAVLSARLVMVRGQPHILSVVHDVTERKLLEIRLQKQASTDVLTGAANRRFFIESAGYELQQAQHLNRPLSVALIDLDHFKQVNDNFGHTEGDHVLVEFTRLCEQNIRDGDILARFGGDEFAMLLPNSDVTQAVAVAERIQLALVTPVLTTGNVPLMVTISVGIAEMRSKPETLDEILARADQALYRVKASGRNRIEIYQEAVPNL